MGGLKVAVKAHPNGNIRETAGQETILIQVQGGPVCAASPAPPPPEEASGNLTTASLGAAPAFPGGLIAAAGSVGALAGAAVAWRLWRP